MESTKHCRENASIFDVSHMCGATFKVQPVSQMLAGQAAEACCIATMLDAMQLGLIACRVLTR